MVTEEQVAEGVICGPDPEPTLAAIRKYAEAGFGSVSLHQIGPDQPGFFDFYQRELLPKLQHEYQGRGSYRSNMCISRCHPCLIWRDLNRHVPTIPNGMNRTNAT